MSDGTAIEWSDATWNVATGCDRVSPGCAHCYALDLAARLKLMGNPRYQVDGGKTSGPGFGLTLHPDKLDQPLRWRRPRRIFVNSMSDLFHEEIPTEFIARVFGRMAEAHWHTFQVLTKRPARMLEVLSSPQFENVMRRASGELGHQLPLPNVWLGVSIENRRFVHRADLLRRTPAAVRFISAEPLLGPLIATDGGRNPTDYGTGWEDYHYWEDGRPVDDDHPQLSLGGIDWLIVGGESGPAHRPMDVQWVRDLRDVAAREQYRGDGTIYRTAFFFKQVGGRTPKAGGRLLDGRTWDEFPTPPTEIDWELDQLVQELTA